MMIKKIELIISKNCYLKNAIRIKRVIKVLFYSRHIVYYIKEYQNICDVILIANFNKIAI